MQIQRTIKGQRRFTVKERQRYQELWSESGLSKRAFCSQEQLSLSTFMSWFRQKQLVLIQNQEARALYP